FFFQAEDGIRDKLVTGVQTCALPICGWSWGGCLACFNAGVHPDRWRAIFAGIPSGDFVAAHHACAPELQAWDDAVYGGSPEEVRSEERRVGKEWRGRRRRARWMKGGQ